MCRIRRHGSSPAPLRFPRGVAFISENTKNPSVIASVAFRNFKALRNAGLKLTSFNLVLGPNGSGKTSLIDALCRLRALSALGPVESQTTASSDDPKLSFRFHPPHEQIGVELSCVDNDVCNTLHVLPVGVSGWPQLQKEISHIRNFEFDHVEMGRPAARRRDAELSADGGNLAAVIAAMQETAPEAFAAFTAEVLRLFPEFSGVFVKAGLDGKVALAFSLAEEAKAIEAGELAQGMIFMLGVLALAFAPNPPAVVCFEELDRGIHPRMLREIRDALYRLSYPTSFGMHRAPVQVIATTHSPYLLDLFRDHPEEVVLTQKTGRQAHFERLADRADLPALMEEGTLGDLWFSGILGGVPERE